MKLGKLRTSEQKETEGVWMDAVGNLRLKLARLGNKKYQAYLREISKPHLSAIRRQAVEAEKVDSLTQRGLAKYVVLDWQNLEDDAGNPVPYSPEKALELLTTLPEFYRMVLEMSNDIEQFREEDTAETLGNSEKFSSGTSTGDSTKES